MSNIKNQKNDSFVDDELNQLYSHFKVIKEKNKYFSKFSKCP